MSPAAFWCWNACVHCWRLRPSDTGLKWNEVKMPDYNDDVKRVVDRLIEEQRKMLSGYKDHKNVDKKMFEEAMDPKHVAISLTGEPTLYNKLEDLIMEFHRRGMTTFLVTRGVRPDVILNLKEKPSQLYISMEAYNKEMYEWLNQPLVPNAWELTMETLKGLPEYGRPTVLRITLMKGINMDEKAINGFAKIVEIMQPTYIEPKGYMYVGASMLRLSRDNMPTHDEVRKFAEELSKATGYPIRSESKPSRIVLLSKLDKPIRFGKGCPEGWNSEY
ncbi:Wyosine base formation [Fervidicoccus fontis Kam940]|uniref:Wyosine base formation n=2 Tax=Fervidicoccus fontis TaxID=683846 RepID=I0A028_FERFK|nr:Wyosine base formation [Fervidicoccus fontis Kam940]